MTPRPDHQRLQDALSVAVRHASLDRAAALDAACGDDAALREEVSALLRSRDEMGTFLADPLFPAPLDAGAIDASPDAVPPELLAWDRYEVIARIGSGGMATVYKAWDPRLRRTLAIKVISERDATTVARFVREAESQARVDHDNVLKIFETGTIGPHHYIAMQYVDGPTLAGVRGETTIEGKVRLMMAIADGLHAAHRLGLVHRDIKPGNILVERGSDGLKPYLLDFGLAAEIGAPGLTQTGVIVGTPRYMAPERIQHGDAALDRRSDIYSLGATFYEFVCGTAPHDSTSGLQVLVDVLERDIPPLRTIDPSLPPELDAVIGKCLEKDPQRRYASARALAEEFDRYLNGDPVLARPTGRLSRLARKARHHPRIAGAFAALAIALAAIAAWGGYQRWRSARQSEAAEQFGQEVENLAWMYRAAQMSPLHAIGPQKEQVRQGIARIERMTRALGSPAYGPGHYALGRGYLTLGDDARALAELQIAWNAGYRTADAAMALGLVHGEILRAETAKARRIDDNAARDARLRELARTHGDPGLVFLTQGRLSTIAQPLYVDALVAAHGDDRAGAIAKADEAARATPWLFEARLLAGQIAFDEAVELFDRGNDDRAAERTDEADRQYEAAEAVAPSAIDAHVGRCAAAGFMLHLILHRVVRDAAPVAARADQVCARAIAVDAAAPEAHRFYAEAVGEWGNVHVNNWLDPGDAYERAAAYAEDAVRLSRGDLEDRLALADVYMNRAWWQGRWNDDPRSSLARAIGEYDAVLALDARMPGAADNRAQALVIQYRYEIVNGLDPLASIDRAIAAFENTLRGMPTYAGGFLSITRVALERADEQKRRGVDPARGLEEVIGFLEALPPADAPPARGTAVSQLRARLASAMRR